MDTYEELLTDASADGIDVIDYNFNSKRIKGLYCDNTIAIQKDIKTTAERACVLAEELGHYHTTAGNILDQTSVGNRKQELRARAWAYNKMIGLTGIVDAHRHNCSSVHDMAEFLDVTEEFLQESLAYYKSKYGTHTKIDNYVIYFEPSIGVFELI